MSWTWVVLWAVYGVGVACMVVARVLALPRERSMTQVVVSLIFVLGWPLFAASMPVGMIEEALEERREARARGGRA